MRRLARLAPLAVAWLWVTVAAAMPITPVAGESGVTAWLVEDHSLPIVTISFSIAGGAALDRPGKSGTASMAASLLDEGAGPYDAAAFRSRLEDLAAQMRFNAGKDEFTGSLRSLKRDLPETAEMLRYALTEPHFAADAIERVRGEILALLARQERSPHSLSSRLWMREAFEDHPYGSHAGGTEASVAAIARADLVEFAAQRLQRDGLAIGVVGDITKPEAEALLDRVFGALPQGTAGPPVADARVADDGALVVRRWPVPQSVVTFGQVGPKRDDPDWYAALLLNDIMGGSNFRGRLMQEIREKRGLAYGVSTQLVPYRHAGVILGNVATENARVAESIALIRAEWRRLGDQGPSEAELEAAKTYLTGSFPLSLDSTQRVAGLLVQLQSERLGIDYLDRRAGLFNGVTIDRARQGARRLFAPARLSFVVVGDPADVTPTRQPRAVRP